MANLAELGLFSQPGFMTKDAQNPALLSGINLNDIFDPTFGDYSGGGGGIYTSMPMAGSGTSSPATTTTSSGGGGSGGFFDLLGDIWDFASPVAGGIWSFIDQRDSADTLKDFARSSVVDPFGAHNRQNYQGRLNALYNDPNYLENLPGYQFARDQGIGAVEAAAAKRGRTYSGGIMEEIAQFTSGHAAQTYEKERNALMQMAGANFAPQGATAGQMLAMAEALNRNAPGALFGGINTTRDGGTQGGPVGGGGLWDMISQGGDLIGKIGDFIGDGPVGDILDGISDFIDNPFEKVGDVADMVKDFFNGPSSTPSGVPGVGSGPPTVDPSTLLNLPGITPGIVGGFTPALGLYGSSTVTSTGVLPTLISGPELFVGGLPGVGAGAGAGAAGAGSGLFTGAGANAAATAGELSFAGTSIGSAGGGAVSMLPALGPIAAIAAIGLGKILSKDSSGKRKAREQMEDSQFFNVLNQAKASGKDAMFGDYGVSTQVWNSSLSGAAGWREQSATGLRKINTFQGQDISGENMFLGYQAGAAGAPGTWNVRSKQEWLTGGHGGNPMFRVGGDKGVDTAANAASYNPKAADAATALKIEDQIASGTHEGEESSVGRAFLGATVAGPSMVEIDVWNDDFGEGGRTERKKITMAEYREREDQEATTMQNAP